MLWGIGYSFGILWRQVTLMVMVKKANVKKSGSRALFSKYWPVLLFVIILLTAGGVYGYNKYLDRQNVADMKQLLADFEKLKTDIESETGEKLLLGFNCGDLEEKFTKTPACYVYLESMRDKPYDLSKVLEGNLPEKLKSNESCASFTGTSFIFSNSKKVIYSCYPLVIRANSKPEIDKLTRDYKSL